jgi:hypothetical protein
VTSSVDFYFYINQGEIANSLLHGQIEIEKGRASRKAGLTVIRRRGGRLLREKRSGGKS